MTAAVNIVKDNLLMANEDTNVQEMGADDIAIDQLIRGIEEYPCCCRHYVAATTVVFEYIQKLSGEAGNNQLSNVVMFENDMPEINHTTAALVIGNNLSVIEPLYYAQGAEPYVDGNYDASFSDRHSSMILYTTT